MSKLQEERLKRNLSQKELAEIVGVARITIQEYERGIRDIRKASFIVIYKIAKYFNITMEELVEI